MIINAIRLKANSGNAETNNSRVQKVKNDDGDIWANSIMFMCDIGVKRQDNTLAHDKVPFAHYFFVGIFSFGRTMTKTTSPANAKNPEICKAEVSPYWVAKYPVNMLAGIAIQAKTI